MDFSGLLDAASRGNVDEVEALLSAGIRPTCKQEDGTWGARKAESPLHRALEGLRTKRKPSAAELAQYEAVIDRLLDAGADVNALHEDYNWKGSGSSETALDMAISVASNLEGEDNPEFKGRGASLLRKLVAKGGDVNRQTVRNIHSMRTDGRITTTMLHAQIASGNANLCEVLLDAKADANTEHVEQIDNERGYNQDKSMAPLHAAVDRNDEETALALTQLLLRHGADVNAEMKFLEQEEVQVDTSADDYTDDPRDPQFEPCVRCVPVRQSALHIAVKKGHASVVEALVEAGANVEASARKDLSPVSMASLIPSGPAGDACRTVLSGGSVVLIKSALRADDAPTTPQAAA